MTKKSHPAAPVVNRNTLYCNYCHFKCGSATLSHEGPDAEPETVEQGEIVLYESGGGAARVGVVPLVRGEPAAQKKGNISQMSRHVPRDGRE